MENLRTLAGRYRLLGHLARGGMADVFEGEDLLLGRRVAIKVLHQQFSSDAAFIERFRREAQAAANLSHPNIVSIFDWGVDEKTYFMVMELIQGRTLRDVLRTEGALLPRRAVEISLESAAALSVAHQSGLSHRDVKPGNIMLTPDGSVKVTDFGIARAFDDSEELTKTGAVIGTATYFSPEQAQGMRADPRSDIYSLGVVLYEMLTGQPPFTGESPVAVAYQHVSEYPPPVTGRPDVSQELEAIVMTALQKDPAARYQSAEELRSDLVRYLRNETPMAMPAAQDHAEAATALMTHQPAATVPPDEIARHAAYAQDDRGPSQPVFILGVVLLVLALIVGLYLLVQLISSPANQESVVVPELTGMLAEDAFDVLQGLDLKVRPSQQPSAEIGDGLVITTDPVGGTEVAPESFVTVFVSTGPEQFSIPLFVGLTEQEARDLAAENGLVVDRVVYEANDEVDEGIVLSQSPPSGTDVAPGTEIDMVVSLGPNAISLPDITGLAERTGLFQLIQEGFGADEELLITIEEFSLDVPQGFIIRTEPLPGTLVPRTGTITIYVSKGAAVVPDLSGLTVAEARALVEELELVLSVGSATVPVTPASQLEGLVAGQEPPAGTQVGPGALVNVQLGAIPQVVVPDLDGLTEAEAFTLLDDLGLVLVLGGTQPTDPSRVGGVVAQNPAPGGEVPIETEITVFIGEPRIVTVPDIVGMTLEDAELALADVGLILVEVAREEGVLDEILSQDPDSGTQLAEGSQVLVIVGSGVTTTTTSPTTTQPPP